MLQKYTKDVLSICLIFKLLQMSLTETVEKAFAQSISGSSMLADFETWNKTWNKSQEQLRCFSCQSESKDSDCFSMNKTEHVQMMVCEEKQEFCKSSVFHGNMTFRYVNRTCASECVTGCFQSPGAGDNVHLDMCYYCCNDYHLCNTKNTAAAMQYYGPILFAMTCILLLCQTGTNKFSSSLV